MTNPVFVIHKDNVETKERETFFVRAKTYGEAIEKVAEQEGLTLEEDED